MKLFGKIKREIVLVKGSNVNLRKRKREIVTREGADKERNKRE